jgi:hypothetical protein
LRLSSWPAVKKTSRQVRLPARKCALMRFPSGSTDSRGERRHM